MHVVAYFKYKHENVWFLVDIYLNKSSGKGYNMIHQNYAPNLHFIKSEKNEKLKKNVKMCRHLLKMLWVYLKVRFNKNDLVYINSNFIKFIFKLKYAFI